MIKWNSKPSTPLQIKDEAAHKSKRAIFPSLSWGTGVGVQIFHLFYPRLKVRVATLVVKPCSYLVSAVKFLIQSTFLNTVNFGTSTMHVSVLEKVK